MGCVSCFGGAPARGRCGGLVRGAGCWPSSLVCGGCAVRSAEPLPVTRPQFARVPRALLGAAIGPGECSRRARYMGMVRCVLAGDSGFARPWHAVCVQVFVLVCAPLIAAPRAPSCCVALAVPCCNMLELWGAAAA
jgi:hypothetical protein